MQWFDLAARVLEGESLGHEEALQVLRADDEELLELLAAVYRIRKKYLETPSSCTF